MYVVRTRRWRHSGGRFDMQLPKVGAVSIEAMKFARLRCLIESRLLFFFVATVSLVGLGMFWTFAGTNSGHASAKVAATEEVESVDPDKAEVAPNASTVPYYLLPASARSWVVSGVADISGGRAETPGINIDSLYVEIQTHYSFPGFQLIGSTASPTTGVALMTHGVAEGSLSRCQWGAPYASPDDSTLLLCSYLG